MTAQLRQLDSTCGLEQWRDAVIAHAEPHRDRSFSSQQCQEWTRAIRTVLGRMRDAGVLRPEAEPDALATGLVAAFQGGLLLARMTRDATSVKIALDMAVDRVKGFATGRPADSGSRSLPDG
ncbi:MAG: TetR family transcriptional regulator C-terminal domain-containing protein [Actinoallomurus sp.]